MHARTHAFMHTHAHCSDIWTDLNQILQSLADLTVCSWQWSGAPPTCRGCVVGSWGVGWGGWEGRRRELEGENWMYPVTCWHDALGFVVVAKPSTCGRKWLVTWLLFHKPRFFPMSMFSPPSFIPHPHPHPQWVNCASSSRHPCWTSLLPELDGGMGIRAGAECFFYIPGWKSPDSLWDGLLVMMLLFFPPLPTISLKYSNLDKSASPPSTPLPHTQRHNNKTKHAPYPFTPLPHMCCVAHITLLKPFRFRGSRDRHPLQRADSKTASLTKSVTDIISCRLEHWISLIRKACRQLDQPCSSCSQRPAGLKPTSECCKPKLFAVVTVIARLFQSLFRSLH